MKASGEAVEIKGRKRFEERLRGLASGTRNRGGRGKAGKKRRSSYKFGKGKERVQLLGATKWEESSFK